MKDSSDYITNINKLLQSIKSDIRVDFIRLENLEVMIITNKVITSLNLQMIEKYIKNAKHIIAKEVKVPCLP